jgi:uncharacterized membrane protein
MSRQQEYGYFKYILPAIFIVCLIGVGLMGGTAVLLAILMPLIIICVFAFTPFAEGVPFWQKALLIVAFFIMPYVAVRFAVLPMSAVNSYVPLSTLTITYDVDMMYAFALVVASIVIIGLFGMHRGYGRYAGRGKG